MADAQEAKAASPKGRYRKVEVRTWGDEKFRALSPLPPSGQGLWLYLMTGPHTGPIPGLFKAGRAAMAEDLDWELEAFDKAFAEVFGQGMAKADFKAKVVWLPSAVKHNRPESPNVVKSWGVEFDLIPECDLKREAFEALKASIHALGESFGKAFDETFGKPSSKPSAKTKANQEQEQEQEQEEKAVAAAPAPPRKRVSSSPDALKPEDVNQQTWDDWVDLRKKKKTTVSVTAVDGAREEAAKADMSLEAFLRVWCRRGSQGLDASWITPSERASVVGITVPSAPGRDPALEKIDADRLKAVPIPANIREQLKALRGNGVH